ncbi:MAG: O-antigen ligase family protein [Endozoicomonas sp.]
MSYLVNPISLSIMAGFVFLVFVSLTNNRLLTFGVLLLSIAMMILTGSKGPIVGLLLALFMKYRGRILYNLSSLLIAMLVILFVLYLELFHFGYSIDSEILTRLYDYEVFKSQSFLSRLEIYTYAAKLAFMNPFGFGPDGYLQNGGVFGSPHNIIFEVFINFGFLLSIPIMILLIVLVYKAVGVGKPLGIIGFYFLVCGQFSVGFPMIPAVVLFLYLEMFYHPLNRVSKDTF